MILEQLGWDETFAADLARLEDPLLCPARVSRASRDFYTLLGPAGEIAARCSCDAGEFQLNDGNNKDSKGLRVSINRLFDCG